MWFAPALALALIGCPGTPLSGGPDGPPPAVPDVSHASAAAAALQQGDDRIHTRGEPAAAALRAPVLEAPLPSGAAILRDCGGPSGAAGGARWWSAVGCSRVDAPAPLAVEEAPPAEPTSAPTPDAAAPDPAVVETGTSREGAAAQPPRRPALRPAPAPAPIGGERGRDLRPAGDVGGAEDGQAEAEPELVLEDADDALGSPIRPTDEEERAERQNARREKPPTRPAPVPAVGWGDTVFLSNDDSMSLASAQRLLYALSRDDVPLQPGQIRKHELLNYFSFDTAAPPAGRTFAVLGSARREGDQLSVALAVRGANPPRQPLDLTLVVDRSGSMAAEGRMDYVKRGLQQLVTQLQPGDRVDLVWFDDRVCTPVEGLVVGRDSVQPLVRAIDAVTPRGATDLDAGLREAYRIQTGRDAADVHGRSRRVVVITDAELNRGVVAPALVARIGEALDQHDVRLSGVGVGRTFDDAVLDQLTERGRGAYVYLGSEAVVDRVFGVGFDALVRTVAHDVQFALDLPDSLGVAKFYGEEISTDARDVQPVHFHAGTSQVFLQDLQIRDGRLVGSDPITLRISFRDAVTREPVTEELRTTVDALVGADPHNVDKARALMAFADWSMAAAVAGRPDCGAPTDAWAARAGAVPDDAELHFVDGLVRRRCPGAARAASTVPLRIRIDSDVSVAAAELVCDVRSERRTLSGADSVARFDAIPGPCVVMLEPAGGRRLPVTVEIAPAATDLRCWVRGGRAGCG